MFVLNEFNHKTDPTYLPENIWALSFEELMRDYFCPQGYNATNPSVKTYQLICEYYNDYGNLIDSEAYLYFSSIG